MMAFGGGMELGNGRWKGGNGIEMKRKKERRGRVREKSVNI